MKVKELIRQLKKQSPEATVYIATKDEDYPFAEASSGRHREPPRERERSRFTVSMSNPVM